jgi:hypothetical protein
MAEFAIEFNPEQMIGKLNDLQKLVIPKAAEMALNETAFAIREQMKQEIKNVFYKPVPLTINSTLYKKASGDQQQLQTTMMLSSTPLTFTVHLLAEKTYHGRSAVSAFMCVFCCRTWYSNPNQGRSTSRFGQPTINKMEITTTH